MLDEAPSSKKHRGNVLPKLTALLFLVCIITIAASIFFYKKYQDARDDGTSAQADLVERLSRTVQLPDEKPTIVTVADKDKLSNEILAARVKDKDMLLIFSGAKRLVVYRPSNEKVIDMLTFANKSDLPKDDGAATQTQSSTTGEKEQH